MSRSSILVYFIMPFLGLSTTLSAQDAGDRKLPPVARKKAVEGKPKARPKVTGAVKEKAEAEAKVEPEIIKSERSIYLPYDELEEVFEKEGRGVFLPYREFLDLWNQLTIEKEKDKEKPPTDGVISNASYRATVEGDEDRVLAVEAEFEVESFKEEGWAVVPLAKSGLNIAEAETGDATLLLGAKGYELILPKKGSYSIKLKLYAKVLSEAGKNDVHITLPKAGVSKFEATIPDQGWDFDLKPASAYSTVDKGSDTQLSFFFGETEKFHLTWQKQGEETALTPLLFVDSDTVVSVVPGALQTSMTLDYRILRSPVETFAVQVPEGQEILSVQGENIREWGVEKSGQQQVLQVALHSEARESYRLKILLEQAIGSLPTELSLPQIEASDVVRQRGSLLVTYSSELELETLRHSGLTQQSLEVGNDTVDEGLPYARYRYLALPYDLSLAIKKAEPVVEVESWTRYEVETDSAKFTTRFDYDIKRAGIFATRIEIPSGFDGIEAAGPDVKDYSEETVDGTRILTVTLRNRTLGTTAITVTGRQIRAAADSATVIPVFSPQDVERHEGKVGLSIDSSLDPRTTDLGDLRQQEVSLLGGRIPGAGSMQIGFRYRGKAAPATIGYTLKKPQVTGEVLTMVEVKEQIIRYQWTVVYRVRYAGVDSFLLSVPESIAEDLRHEGALIKEVDKSYTEEGMTPPDGHRFWQVSLRDKQMGTYQLKLFLDQPTNALVLELEDGADPAGDARNFAVSLPEIQLHQVQTETGQIAIAKDDNLEILDAQTTSLESIDPQELNSQLRRSGIFLSYKYRRHPHALDLAVSRNEFLPVPQAVATYADVTSVLSSDAALTTQVIYWVKNNAKQFFSIDLPEGGQIVSDIFVDGQPQQPMRRANEDVVLIRLPAKQNDATFPIRFIYQIPSEHPGKKLGVGSVDIPIVELTDAEVLQSRIQLYVPEGYRYRKFKSAMSMPVSERGWTRFRNAFDWLVPTLGPQLAVGDSGLWQDPPALQQSQQAGFDMELPTGGRKYAFHRLDAPSDIRVVYRAQSYALFLEAFVGLLAFAGAVLLLWRSVRWRFLYFMVFGALPLVIAGAVSPSAASFWTAIYLGTLLGVLVWIARGIPRFIKWLGGLIAAPFLWLSRKLKARRQYKQEQESAKRVAQDEEEA